MYHQNHFFCILHIIFDFFSYSSSTSKRYHEFRSLAKKLREVINNDRLAKGNLSWESLSQSMKDIFKLSNSLTDIIDSEGTSYLGKVKWMKTYCISFFMQKILIMAFVSNVTG